MERHALPVRLSAAFNKVKNKSIAKKKALKIRFIPSRRLGGGASHAPGSPRAYFVRQSACYIAQYFHSALIHILYYMVTGVLDSGIGGLTTLSEILRVRGGGEYIYFADAAHCPYGDKSAAQIAAIVRAGAVRLMDEGAECIVLACNTATACAIDGLRSEFEKTTFVGTEPCIKTAKIYGKRLCVLATPLTIRQPRFARLLNGEDCFIPDCAPLAAEIEHGYPHLTGAYKMLAKILAPCRNEKFDACVLGCTHYCLIKDHVQKLLRCPVLDGNNGVARQLRKLAGASPDRGKVRLITSAPDIYTLRAAAEKILRRSAAPSIIP